MINDRSKKGKKAKMRVNLEFLRQSDLKKKPKPAFGRKSEKSLKSVF